MSREQKWGQGKNSFVRERNVPRPRREAEKGACRQPPAPLALPNKPSAAQDADAGGAVFTSSFSREVATSLFLPCCLSHACGPRGLISCLQKAVTVVDLCDVTVVEKCARGRLAHVPGGRSPHLCVSRSEGAGLVRPLDNLARSRPPGVSVATGLTAREENLEFTGEEMGSSASSSCSPLSPGQGPPQQL